METSAAGDARLEIGLIGELCVRRDGQVLPLPRSRKCRALLAFLAATGKPQRRERLCELLWEVPDDPKGALRWSLSKLRAILGDALVADRETARIDGAAVTVDLAALLAAETDAPELLGRDFAEGLDLPRCPDFQAWLAAIREDVRQAQLHALAAAVERRRADPVAALPYARLRVERDPLGEQARVDLVALLEAAGRGDEAKRQRALSAAALREADVPVPTALTHPKRDRSASPVQRIRFCKSADGTRIAFTDAGTGPVLIRAGNWLSHLDYELESPLHRHWIDELIRARTFVRYDARGSGLSDRGPADLSLDALAGDLEAVAAETAEDGFDLLGISQGCAAAIAFAARHPERVRRLVLFGGFLAGWSHGSAEIRSRWEAMITLTGDGWGEDNPAFRQMFTSLLLPNATPDQARRFNDLQRASATPPEAERLQRALGALDVRHLAASVRAPTIVFHCRGDAMVPFDAGLALAARIPGAAFVGLDSENHLPLEDEPAWAEFVRHLRDFLA